MSEMEATDEPQYINPKNTGEIVKGDSDDPRVFEGEFRRLFQVSLPIGIVRQLGESMPDESGWGPLALPRVVNPIAVVYLSSMKDDPEQWFAVTTLAVDDSIIEALFAATYHMDLDAAAKMCQTDRPSMVLEHTSAGVWNLRYGGTPERMDLVETQLDMFGS